MDEEENKMKLVKMEYKKQKKKPKHTFIINEMVKRSKRSKTTENKGTKGRKETEGRMKGRKGKWNKRME